MIRAAIKYCGGCNPSYDRVEWVRRLQELAGLDITWHAFAQQDAVDVLILVSGCERECAAMDVGRFQGSARCVSITCGTPRQKEIVGSIVASEPRCTTMGSR